MARTLLEREKKKDKGKIKGGGPNLSSKEVDPSTIAGSLFV